MNPAKVQTQLNRRPQRELSPVKRVVAGVLGAVLLLGGIVAFVGGGPTEIEMERCRAQAEAQFVYRLQTVGGFGGKGDQLNAYNVFLGDPAYFDRDLSRYREASAGALQRAAADCLRPHQRVALSVVPRGRTALALADSHPVAVS